MFGKAQHQYRSSLGNMHHLVYEKPVVSPNNIHQDSTYQTTSTTRKTQSPVIQPKRIHTENDNTHLVKRSSQEVKPFSRRHKKNQFSTFQTQQSNNDDLVSFRLMENQDEQEHQLFKSIQEYKEMISVLESEIIKSNSQIINLQKELKHQLGKERENLTWKGRCQELQEENQQLNQKIHCVKVELDHYQNSNEVSEVYESALNDDDLAKITQITKL